MKIKIIIITFLLLFTFVNFIPTAKAGLLVNLRSYLQTNFDASNFTSKPIVPLGEIRSLTMYFDYGVNYGGFFKNLAQLFYQFHKNKQVNIKLEIVDHSSWCTPTLFNDVITTKVGEAGETGLQAILNLRLDIDAPAYASGFVEVKVTVPKVGMIDGYSNTFTLEFTPAYVPLIKSKLPEGYHYIITPYNETVIPIEITNLGNGITKVRAEIVNASERWNLSISDVYLDIGITATTYLKVTADHNFENESITIGFTPQRAQGTEVGTIQFVDLFFENDGSYKKVEKGLEIDITLLLILIIILLIIIIIVTTFKNRLK
ncbi:hypothetical protein AYK20_05710 [Thermoplasmatales archaeon SG8-52-1]|nr:MAG: hypothetical protein AYK20_05710 [Thermoplasmatales archaeon SG8-52-1]